MVSRHWRGLVKSGRAKDYLKHLRTETLPALKALPGFIGASVHSRLLSNGVEFVVITQWHSHEDIARFAGLDTEAAVVPAEAAAMMVEYDRRARHFEVME